MGIDSAKLAKRVGLGTAFAAIFLVGVAARAERPFKLMTMESAENPQTSGVVGLQEFGYNFGSVFVDTNPLYDLALTGNIGAKWVLPLGGERGRFAFTLGGRYLNFFGSSLIESRVKQAESRIDKFQLAFQGSMAFTGVTYHAPGLDYHLNLQWADISGSTVTNAVAGVSLPLGDKWGAVVEGGYDFANTNPRGSFGLTRNGPSFGLRLGVTYVRIDDPFVKYSGVAPVVDFFWAFGAGAGKTSAPAEAAAVSAGEIGQ